MELNSAFLVESHGGLVSGTYHKVELFPFGEYVPAPLEGLLGERWHTTGRFAGGGAPQTMRVNRPRGSNEAVGPLGGATVSLAPSICYEAVLPGWFNGLVRKGAQVLVNQTDDSWFGDTQGPALHFDGTRLRAVETRRWLVRASNSGISAIIDPTGETVATLPYGATGTLVGNVGLRDELTPYVMFGDWIVVLAAVIVGLNLVRRLRWGWPP